MTPHKRPVEVVVISDTHLGTYGCHAEELLAYLDTIAPARLVLNGDIIDMWQFSKRYWPKAHMQVLHKILSLAAEGVPVHYLAGNHDEQVRRFVGMRFGNLHIDNKLLLDLGPAGRAWVFHGDVFDVTMQHSKWLAKLGGKGYDMLILMNRAVNAILHRMGRGKISLSAKIKAGVKSAVKFISHFEETAASLALRKGYDFVICGHIHQPAMHTIHTPAGAVRYLNSGDWVENLTALEFNQGEWVLYRHTAQAGTPSAPVHEPVLDARTLLAMLAAD